MKGNQSIGRMAIFNCNLCVNKHINHTIKTIDWLMGNLFLERVANGICCA